MPAQNTPMAFQGWKFRSEERIKAGSGGIDSWTQRN